jgi:hypothetical protein
MSDLSNDTKKHTTKSRETIPLIKDGTFFAFFSNEPGTGYSCEQINDLESVGKWKTSFAKIYIADKDKGV